MRMSTIIYYMIDIQANPCYSKKEKCKKLQKSIITGAQYGDKKGLLLKQINSEKE